jgi:2-polyprenyl-3-methyl-5-hydroxy-6-metoxy-1,4-benzoquinol methylase
MVHFLSLFRYEFPVPPSDPRSAEYRKFWEDQYRIVRGETYTLSNEAHNFAAEREVDVFPYCTRMPDVVGDQLIAIGSILKALGRRGVSTNASILEMGVGWGNTAIQLALTGYRMTVLDLERRYLDIVRQRSEKESVEIGTWHGDFFSIFQREETFDVILFYECFHHCLEHRSLIEGLKRKLNLGGVILFAGETISDTLPYAWGLNPAGQGIWSIRHHGWMELCFHEDYFRQMLQDVGFSVERQECPQTAAGVVFIAGLIGE